MRIHHLNCGTDCPFGGALFDGFSKGPLGKVVCAAQLIETDAGLVLVDTGYGTQDVAHPGRLPAFFRTALNIRFRREETALFQVEALGFKASDVRHIILTHMDFDHAGGIEDFPQARVHVTAVEKDLAENHRRGFVNSRRYQPVQFDGVRDWRTYNGGGEAWFGFEAVRDLDGLPPEILMVPLPGHTMGHAGVAMRTGEGWLLNAGDAYFFRGEMDVARPHCTPGLAGYQRLMEMDHRSRKANQHRLRELKRREGGAVTVMCSHDPKELAALQAGNPARGFATA